MRTLNYKSEYRRLLSPEIVSYLAQIHEMKGQQNLFIEAQQDALAELLEIAKIQSTEASNRIEGIITTDDRLKKIVMNKTTPKGRSEREIAGYRDVLSTVHENYDYIPVRPGMILQLHRDLYKFGNSVIGGSFKNTDNIIAEELPDGTKRVRFQPVPAWETTEAMNTLCNALQEASADPELDPLLLIPMFILDFLCIHPFNDGNGRTARTLSCMMLLQSGYDFFRFTSISDLVAQQRGKYYRAIKNVENSDGDMTYFIDFYSDMLARTVQKMEDHLIHHVYAGQRIRDLEVSGKLNKRQLQGAKWLLEGQQTQITVETWRKKHKVSVETARQDLILLCEQGLLVRTMQGKKAVFRILHENE